MHVLEPTFRLQCLSHGYNVTNCQGAILNVGRVYIVSVIHIYTMYRIYLYMCLANYVALVVGPVAAPRLWYSQHILLA